jgi:hypothetical protein
VSYQAALKAFKIMLERGGLEYKKFGLHSPRIGGATDAFNNNVQHYVIDRQGRWKSYDTKYLYLRQKEKDVVRHIRNASSYS